MSQSLFPHSKIVLYQGFEMEIVERDVFRYPHLLDQIKEDVFKVASYSRGWTDPAGLEAMRKNFKIGPLYEANALVLIRKNGELVGLVGTLNNWHIENKSITHLCSLGLLPEAQNRGFMQVLLSVALILSWQDEVLRQYYQQQQMYVSAITQSPYLISFLGRLFDTYPSPYREAPDQDMTEVAQHVAGRFDPHISFDPNQFVLRNECSFFYKKTPYSTDRQFNQFCDGRLRYDQGDVFVVVGRVSQVVIESFVGRMLKRYPDLFSTLGDSLRLGMQFGVNPVNSLGTPVGVTHG